MRINIDNNNQQQQQPATTTSNNNNTNNSNINNNNNNNNNNNEQQQPSREKEEKKKEVRGIRRCQNEYCGVIMNRDYNAAINIRRHLLYRIEHGYWDPRFCKKKKKIEKESNQPTN